MMSTAVAETRPRAILRDVIALTKPRITLMVVITASAGMWLAPNRLEPKAIALMLAATALVVCAANALNCYLERDSDRFMERTRLRPLPDGRLNPKVALVLGIVMGLISVPALTFVVNPLTGLLGAIALVSYVAIYTPLKAVSPTALLVGSIPGALPALMGWTAATGTLDAPGIVLFSIMFIWQIPHSIAIAIFRQEDYDRAGLKVLPSVRGLPYAKAMTAFYALLLVPVSLLLYPLRVTGLFYLVTALVLGVAFAGVALQGFREEAGVAWARKLFVVSLVYLTILFPVIVLDART